MTDVRGMDNVPDLNAGIPVGEKHVTDFTGFS